MLIHDTSLQGFNFLLYFYKGFIQEELFSVFFSTEPPKKKKHRQQLNHTLGQNLSLKSVIEHDAFSILEKLNFTEFTESGFLNFYC